MSGAPDHSPDPYLAGHGDTRYRVHHYDLDLAYKVATNRLDERAVLDVEIAEATRRIDLDLYSLTADKVTVDGKRARFKRAGAKVTIEVGPRERGDRLQIALRVSGKPRPMPGVHGEAGWEELTDGAMVGSQPQGAPSWFPCNDDAADKATYRISVQTEAAYAVIANGRLAERARRGGDLVWTYVMDRPMAPYLATVQIGRYASTHARAHVPVEIVHPRQVAVGIGTAFARQGEMVDHFASLFGPYPFDQYRAVVVDDVLEIPLEAQGLSSFGRNFAAPGWDHERLVAHELAHQWFGNAVTAQTLADIWLHEGFACYSEWLWSQRRRGWGRSRTTQEWAAYHHAKLGRTPAGATLGEPTMARMFDDWVYKRGALTVHALRAVMGEDAFWPMLRRWVAERSGGTVTTAAFEAHCRSACPEQDERIGQVFADWVYAPALPPLPVIAS